MPRPSPTRPTPTAMPSRMSCSSATTRPIFIRLRLDAGGKAFRTAWLDSVKAIHSYLDRDGDGTLTKDEADRGSLPTMVRAATGGAAALPAPTSTPTPRTASRFPRRAGRGPPARPRPVPRAGRPPRGRPQRCPVQPPRPQQGRHGQQGRAGRGRHVAPPLRPGWRRADRRERAGAVQQPDGGDDRGPDAAREVRDGTAGDRAVVRRPLVPPRAARAQEIRQGNEREGAAAGDNRLSPAEFAIDPKDFASADTDSDGALDTEELRRFLSRVEPDLELVVKLSGSGSAATTIEASGAGSRPLPPEVRVQKLSDGDIEVSIGEVSLEFHADGGEHAAENAKRYYAGQFQAADKDNNKYLEKSEVKDHGPFAALFDMMDKDGDGKLYMKEVDAFVDQQTQAARSQMVLSVADQGRAIFAIVDLNRDRHLGVREIRDAVARVSSWDRNGDGQIRSDEIPHHYQLSIGRGQITAVGMHGVRRAGMMAVARPQAPAAGPTWFRKMDRNRDGDISRREFLGPRADFERLDRDHDGLIDAEEAAKTMP